MKKIKEFIKLISYPGVFNLPAFLLNIGISIIDILSVFIQMFIIDEVVSKTSTHLFQLALLLVVIKLIAYVLNNFLEVSKIKFSYRYKFDLKKKLINRVNEIPLEKAEDLETQNAIELTDKIFDQSIEVQGVLSKSIKLLFLGIALAYLLKNLNPIPIIIYLLILLIIFLVNKKASGINFGFWAQYNKNTRRYNYFSNVLTRREYAYERKIFSFSGQINRRFEEEFDKAEKINLNSARTRLKYQTVLESIIILATISSLLYFINPLKSGSISLGVYTAITQIVFSILAVGSDISDQAHVLSEYLESMSTIDNFMNRQFTVDNQISKLTCSSILCLNSVSFSYDGMDKCVINNVSYDFELGKHYALVGVNGSGKTTLVKLLLGLYPPKSGEVRKGNSIRDLDQYATVLYQDFCNYPLTIREFLLLGNSPDITTDETYAALEKTGILSEISILPEKIDTPLTLLSKNGVLFSSGQMQKLGIARAFLSNCPIIILDEPTASLDPISEKEIYEQSQKIFSDRTTIFITHRLGAIKKVNQIIVMENGKIRERGDHESLMSKGDVYFKLYQTQRSLYDE
ncbi:MAG: ABC transporter ATP-binding protein [Anaerolineaceae bacterium]